MPIRKFATKEEIPAEHQDAAIELKDGTFALLEEADPLGEAGKAALDAERQKAKDAEKARKAAEKERDELKRKNAAKETGITDEQLEALRAEDAERRKKDLDDALTPVATELAETKAKLRKVTLTDQVQTKALKCGVMPDRIRQAMKLLDGRTDLTDTGAIIVKDEDGKLVSTTVDDFLAKDFKKENPWLYAGTGSSGSSASGSTGTGGDDDLLPPADEQAQSARRVQVASNF